LSEGVKAIILRGKRTGRNVMVCVPADQKLDTKPVETLEQDKFEFEKPEAIKNKYGLELGAIPPFGNLLGMTVYFDKRVLDEPRAAFNAGSTTKSIIMQSADLTNLISPVMI
jgi:nondiscriminating aspartyl-tRNA synthetase